MNETASPPVNGRETRNVELRVTPAVAQVMANALELYSRIGLGQLDEVAHLARMNLLKNRDGDSPCLEDIEAATSYLIAAKRMLFGYESNASHGIYSTKVPEVFRTAWEAFKAIRHRLAWDRNPQGGLGVAYDEPAPAARSGIRVHSQAPADCLAKLPDGALLCKRGGEWHVLQASEGTVLTLLTKSNQLQTAVLQAQQVAAGRPPRNTTL